MAKAKPAWKNRIVGHGEKPAAEFSFNPANWRRHPQTQRDALNEIFAKVGWVTGVVVNKRTGLLIDGHARIEEALKQGDATPVPFTEVDLSAEEEAKILLLLDPIGNMATTDAEMFSTLAAIADLDTSGLLEVVADVSRNFAVEVAELPKQATQGASEMLQYMTFNGKRIPLTDEEAAELDRRYDKYVEENQVIYGFAGELLCL